MAKALKCDRCGSYYDESDCVPPYVIGIRNDVGRFTRGKDLCDKCSRMLEIFMNNKVNFQRVADSHQS